MTRHPMAHRCKRGYPMKSIYLLAVLFLTWPTSGSSAVAVTTLGQGNSSCGAWTEARRSNHERQYIFAAWIAGFLSMYNVDTARDQQVDILEKPDAESVWAWADNFCRDHPLDTIAHAA